MGKTKKDLLIYGYYGAGNFGDDLLLSCVLSALGPRRDKSDNWYIASEGVRELKGQLYEGFRVIPRRNALSRGTAKVLWGGGGMFFSFADSKKINPFSGCSAGWYAKDWVRGWPNSFASSFYGFGLGLGPFASGVHAQMTSLFLKKFSYLSLRDDVSMNWAVAHGVDVSRGADLSFLAYKSLQSRSAKALNKDSNGGMKLLIA